MRLPLNFLGFLSLVSSRVEVSHSWDWGSVEVSSPPRWRLCRWTAVQQPDLAPSLLSHSAIQLENRLKRDSGDLEPPGNPWRWDSQTFPASGDPCIKVGKFLWPLTSETQTRHTSCFGFLFIWGQKAKERRHVWGLGPAAGITVLHNKLPTVWFY